METLPYVECGMNFWSSGVHLTHLKWTLPEGPYKSSVSHRCILLHFLLPATLDMSGSLPPLKGNRKERSNMGFFFESVDLYLVSTFKMVKINRVHVRDVISVIT